MDNVHRKMSKCQRPNAGHLYGRHFKNINVIFHVLEIAMCKGAVIFLN